MRSGGCGVSTLIDIVQRPSLTARKQRKAAEAQAAKDAKQAAKDSPEEQAKREAAEQKKKELAEAKASVLVVKCLKTSRL